MEADELFDHALCSLPEAVGDLLRDGLDPGQFVFASFDGASQLGIALIASDLAGGLGGSSTTTRAEVLKMIIEAERQGEELVVSFMITKDILTRLLHASTVDETTRVAVGLWLENPLLMGHFRVVAVAGEHVRAEVVDGVTELDDAPISSSLLN